MSKNYTISKTKFQLFGIQFLKQQGNVYLRFAKPIIPETE